jgi:hypothetical protein
MLGQCADSARLRIFSALKTAAHSRVCLRGDEGETLFTTVPRGGGRRERQRVRASRACMRAGARLHGLPPDRCCSRKSALFAIAGVAQPTPRRFGSRSRPSGLRPSWLAGPLVD